jgi:hypothetical protein
MDVLKLMTVLISQPWLALVPAAVFLVGAAASKSRAALVVTAMWVLYCGYELAMKYRIMCSGDCNIRIDLLALYPLLLAASVVGLVAIARRMFRRTNA